MRFKNLLNGVVLVNIPPVLLRLLVEGNQPLSVGGVRIKILLPGKDEVRVTSNSSAVSDKVGYWLHDVPAVLPPGQPGQDAKLNRHHTETNLSN